MIGSRKFWSTNFIFDKFITHYLQIVLIICFKSSKEYKKSSRRWNLNFMIKMYTKNYSIIHVIIFIQKGLQNCIQSTITLNNLSFSFGSHGSGHSITICSFRQMYYCTDKYKNRYDKKSLLYVQKWTNQNQRTS